MGATTKEIGCSSFNEMISSVDRRSEYVENRAGANVRVNNFLTPYTLDNKSSILNAPCGYSNGVYASLRPVATYGAELVTNGDFSNGTNNWTPNTNATLSIDNSKLKVAISGAASGYPSQNITTIVGKKYNITADAFIGTATKVSLYSAAFGFNDLTADGSYNLTFTATSTSTQIRLYVYGDGTYGLWDNISVKQVTDADFDFTRGSAATRVTKDGLIKNVQILSGNLVQNGNFEEIGSELITNGDFATDSDWTLLEDVSIGNGVATFLDTGSNPNTRLIQSNILTSGKAYKLTLEVTRYVAGRLQILFGTSPTLLLDISSGVGTYTIYGVSNGTDITIKRNGSYPNFDFDIDNVSVKEVGQNWDLTDGATITDNGVRIVSDGTNQNITQTNALVVSKKYKVQYEIIQNNSGQLSASLSFGTGVTVNSTVGVHTFTAVALNTSLQFKRLAACDITITNISVIEITEDTNLPRIDYTSGTGSLLLEPQSTNLFTYSEDFSQWGLGDTQILSTTHTNPEGTKNTKVLAYNGGTNQHYMSFSPSVSSGQDYTFSVFLKAKELKYVCILFLNGVSGRFFDLENGTFLGTFGATPSNSKIEDYGNGWYRCSITDSATSTTKFSGVYLSEDGTSLGPFTPTNTNGVYVWGAMMEQQSYPTSYIPTNGSTVTRNADVCNNAGSSDLINSTEGVLYAEISVNGLLSSGFSIMSLNDGGVSNNVFIEIGTNGLLTFFVISGGTNVASKVSSVSPLNNFVKCAIKYKLNDVSFWINGTEIHSDTSAVMPVGLRQLDFDYGNGAYNFYGNVRSVAVFKEALTDEELAKITSTTQQEVFYEMRDKMLQINADYYEFGDYTTRLKKLF